MSSKKNVTQNGIDNEIIERMKDQNIYTHNHNESNKSDDSTSIWNRDIFDLQTLLTHRQDRLWSVLHEHYKHNTSIKRGQKFLLNHVDSKLFLSVMYADLVVSTKMSMYLPLEMISKIVKVFLHELSSVVESYNGFILKYVGDVIIDSFL